MLHTLLAKCTEDGDCWLWGGPMANGSPQVYVDGRYLQARRLMYEAVVGPIPEGKHITMMKCREPACLNADHMAPLTVREVAQLAAAEGRFSTPMRRAAISRGRRAGAGAKLTLAKAAAIRACRTAAEAAAEFGVHKSMAARIRRGEAWAEVSGASAFTFRP